MHVRSKPGAAGDWQALGEALARLPGPLEIITELKRLISDELPLPFPLSDAICFRPAGSQ